MKARKLQLNPPKERRINVIKADGSREEYIHTKVVGAIANALGTAGQGDPDKIGVAEELAEAVTFFLYHTKSPRGVSSSEIFSIIQAVLAGTGYEEAAAALSEHHFERKLKRCRVEVVNGRTGEPADTELLYNTGAAGVRTKWEKSRIVEDLVAKYGLSRQTARTIASMVEERVFNMGISVVPAGLVRQLVLNDAAAILNAQKQLQTV
jgi:transcriptional regulator NrdR family protein